MLFERQSRRRKLKLAAAFRDSEEASFLRRRRNPLNA
jgi:hypothetical protein